MSNINYISIHALREEGDFIPILTQVNFNRFLSTPSARRATTTTKEALTKFAKISIHALREEGDGTLTLLAVRLMDFYPRPPRGGRLSQKTNNSSAEVISIHALREEGDLPHMGILFLGQTISIHALREEGDHHYYSRLHPEME